LTVIITVLRTVSILTVYEKDIGYYARGAIIPKIQLALIIVSSIMTLSVLFFKKRGELPADKPALSSLTTFASFLCGTLHISSAVMILLYQRGATDTVTVVILVGFISAAVFFFYDSLCPSERKSPYSILLAIVAVLGLVAVIVKTHLDYTVTLNNPNKTMLFLTLGALCYYTVQELRFILGISQPRIYLFSASLSFMLCVGLSVPGIIGHYANKLSGGAFLIYYIITFAYGVYVFTRLSTYIKYARYYSSVTENITEVEE